MKSTGLELSQVQGYPLTIDPRVEWQYKHVPNMLAGINMAVREDLLKDEEAISVINLHNVQGKLISDTGYLSIGQDLLGTAQGEFSFRRIDETTDTMLVTTQTLYKFNSTHRRYHFVKGSVATTTTSEVIPVGAHAIPVVSTAGLVVGDWVGITTSDGDQHQSSISQILGLLVILTTPTIKQITFGATFIRAVVLTGDLDHQVDAITVPSHDWFVFTNGINIVKRYNGTDTIDVPGLPSGGNVICRAVAVYNSALFLLATTEGGTFFPQRVRRSDQADPTNWTTGTAGKDDLYDSADGVMCGKVLGPYLIVYRERTVVRGQFIGAAGLNYQFDPVISGENADGAISTRSVIELPDFHIFAGQHGIYAYKGDFSISPISDNIFAMVYGPKGNLSPSKRRQVFLLYAKELKEVWFFYPSTNSDGGCDTMLRYNGAWFKREFADEFCGFGLFESNSVFAWDDLVGSWDDQLWTWDTQVQAQQFQTIHLCGVPVSPALAKVFEYDYRTPLDNGTQMPQSIETKDFLAPDVHLRFDMLELAIQGNAGGLTVGGSKLFSFNVAVYYSIDSGESWNTLGFISSDIVDKIQLFKQFLFRKIRFRFVSNCSNFRLDWYAFSYKTESLW